jgi:hypothetical protein
MATTRKPLVAVTTFTATLKDGDRIVRRGQVVAATDPVVKGREELFRPHDPNAPDEAA